MGVKAAAIRRREVLIDPVSLLTFELRLCQHAARVKAAGSHWRWPAWPVHPEPHVDAVRNALAVSEDQRGSAVGLRLTHADEGLFAVGPNPDLRQVDVAIGDQHECQVLPRRRQGGGGYCRDLHAQPLCLSNAVVNQASGDGPGATGSGRSLPNVPSIVSCRLPMFELSGPWGNACAVVARFLAGNARELGSAAAAPRRSCGYPARLRTMRDHPPRNLAVASGPMLARVRPQNSSGTTL
jgi:hypothetical protein